MNMSHTACKPLDPACVQLRSILICSIRLIGDVLLTTPLIKILKDAWPDAKIDVLVNAKTGEFLEKDPRVNRVIYSQSWDVDSNRRAQGKGYLWDIFRRYDLTVNMSASDRGAIASLFASRKYRVTFYEGNSFFKDIWKRFFFSHPVRSDNSLHRACLCSQVADVLGLPAKHLESRVFWDDIDHKAVLSLLGSSHDCGYFVVHPFARWRYKFWDMEKIVETSDMLARRYSMQPVWSCAPIPEEQDELVLIAARCRIRPILISGIFSLNRMACLIAGAQLYLGVDTAITHIAATTGVPMISLFGPTPANLWAPWNNLVPVADQCHRSVMADCSTEGITIIQAKLPCFPCGRMGCEGKTKESLCLLKISVDDLMIAVEDLLDTQC